MNESAPSNPHSTTGGFLPPTPTHGPRPKALPQRTTATTITESNEPNAIQISTEPIESPSQGSRPCPLTLKLQDEFSQLERDHSKAQYLLAFKKFNIYSMFTIFTLAAITLALKLNHHTYLPP